MNDRGIQVFSNEICTIAVGIYLRSNLTKRALMSFLCRALSCVSITHPKMRTALTPFGSQTKSIFLVSVNFSAHTGSWAKFWAYCLVSLLPLLLCKLWSLRKSRNSRSSRQLETRVDFLQSKRLLRWQRKSILFKKPKARYLSVHHGPPFVYSD